MRVIATELSLPLKPSRCRSNAARAYLASLNSGLSRATMSAHLHRVAKEMGYADLHVAPWGDLDYLTITEVIDRLVERKLAPTTINSYLAAMKGVAKQAVFLKQMDADTFLHIQSIKSVSGSRVTSGRALEQPEIRALLKGCDQDISIKNLRDAAILSSLLGCGLRRSEVVALDLKDVLMEDSAFRVMGKGNVERIMPLPKQLLPRLERWIYVRGDQPGPLFVRIRRGDNIAITRLTTQAVYFMLQQRRQAAKVKHCAPHDLRRTYATSLFNNGEDIRVVQLALGHANIETTKRYDMSGEQRKRKAIDRLRYE